MVYVWVLDRLGEEDREKWLAELSKPLPFEQAQGAALEGESSFDTPIEELKQLR